MLKAIVRPSPLVVSFILLVQVVLCRPQREFMLALARQYGHEPVVEVSLDDSLEICPNLVYASLIFCLRPQAWGPAFWLFAPDGRVPR
mgnify:CR=1 FL=1